MNTPTPAQALGDAELYRELQEAATDNDTRTIARVMAEIAEESVVQSSRYELILDCYRSGQISPEQWARHLEDELFRRWLRSRGFA